MLPTFSFSKASALLVLFTVSGSFSAFADPACLDKKIKLAINNAQVIQWEKSTPNAYKARGYVTGPISRVFPPRNNHDHFEIRLGNGTGEVLEVVFSHDFGTLPELKEGMIVTACGDYITSTAQTGTYPPSPSGAIIHWIHYNPGDRDKRHEHGFTVVDGKLYGYDPSYKPAP